MPVPIYSRKLVAVQNFGGHATLVNGGPDHYVIMTATIFYGGLTAAQWQLIDQSSAVMLQADLASAGPVSIVYTDLRISWAAGDSIGIQTFFGNVDYTLHGYQLTPP